LPKFKWIKSLLDEGIALAKKKGVYPSRLLLLAILLSIFLHGLLLGIWHIEIPMKRESNIKLEALLETKPPTSKPNIRKYKITRAVPPIKRESPSSERKQNLSELTPPSQSPEQVGEGEKIETSSDSEVSGLTQEDPRESLPPPKHVQVIYDAKRTGFGSGRARYEFELVGDHAYRLSSEIEATGFSSLAFSGKRTERSEGVLDAHGIRPLRYQYEITSKPEKSQLAEFDWTGQKLSLVTPKLTQVVDLPEGTQDYLSFMYQFMFVPPLDTMEHTLTNGKILQTINYQFLGEEEVDTKIGRISSLHIIKSSGETDERTEMWLATDYRFIPIKIVKLTKDGTGYEFIVTSLKIDAEQSKNE
jgi:Protein of unknown function (DUF3108)